MKSFLILTLFVSQTFGAAKLYEVTRNANCEGEQKIVSHIESNNSAAVPNQVNFGGYVEVIEKVLGPLEISIEANRCDHSLKKCEKYSSIKIPGICDIFNSKNGMFTDVLKAFEPRITCPWMPGKYATKDTNLDLSSFSVLPSEGYTWVVTIKGISGDGKNKKLVMCINIEAKISKARERKKKN